MADRKEAFVEWRKGIISDDSLKQVTNDLTLVVEVLSAMGEHGVVMQGFRQQLTSAVSMYDARRRDRRAG
jgi:hypothetical protein